MIVRIRRYFMAGLLVWLPIGATILVVMLLLRIMNRLLALLPPALRSEVLFGVTIPGLDIVVALIVLILTGVLAANLLGRRLVNSYESVLARIPLVRTIYSAVKHFAEIVLSDSNSSFKKVLLIEYPRKGLYSLAFQTSEEPPEVQAATGDEVVTVFLPTTPNPTSGFMLFVPRDGVSELDMPVEDALKMIISLGVIVPEWHPLHPRSEVAPPEPTP